MSHCNDIIYHLCVCYCAKWLYFYCWFKAALLINNGTDVQLSFDVKCELEISFIVMF